MDIKQYFKSMVILAGLFLCMQSALAAVNITSLKHAFVVNNVIYISVAYPMNHEPFEEGLEKLWQKTPLSFTDSHGQSWKKISLSDLREIVGEFDSHYLMMWKGETIRQSPQGAYLFQWACAGGIIPVLSLGESKFKEEVRTWGVRAIGSSKPFPALRITTLDHEGLPENLRKQYSESYGWTLWRGETKIVSLINRSVEHDPAPVHILINHQTNTVKEIVSKSPMDSRC